MPPINEVYVKAAGELGYPGLKDFCMGCGSCIVGCKQKALTFELVRPPEHIPLKPAFPFKMPKGSEYIRDEMLR
jgi:ferredoxin